MLYNKQNTRLKFSTDQFIDEVEYCEMMDEYNALVKDVLRAGLKDFREKLDGEKVSSYDSSSSDDDEDGHSTSKLRSIIISVVVIGLFISMVVSLVMRNLILFGILFGSIFLLGGLMLLVTGRSGNLESASSSVYNRIWGFYMVIMAGTIITLILLRSYFTSTELIIWIAVAAFGLSGVLLISLAIYSAAADKIVYKEEVDAKCVGYVRKVDRINSHTDSSGPSYPQMFISPVFDYTYEGVRYESIYDSMRMKRDSDIELNSFTTIHIDPKHPEGVMSPDTKSKAGGAGLIIMGIAFIGAAVAMLILSFTGVISDEPSGLGDSGGSNVNTAVTEGIRTITDDMIGQNYADDIDGREWYAEEVTVSEVDPSGEEGVSVNFDDITVLGVYLPKDKAPAPGDRWMIFYTIDEEYLEYDKWYKDIFVYADVSEFSYSGTHTAYVNQ